MRSGDALFRVIVLGGLALVSQESCGSAPAPSDAGGDAQNADAFPSELPVFVEASTGDATNDAAIDDANPDAPASPDGFPQEGPAP